MPKTLLIKNGIVVTLGDENRVLHGWAVLCTNDRITKIGRSYEFTGEYDTVIDAGGKVIMPGFVNAHMHFYSTMVRGLGKAEPAAGFKSVLENLWWRLDKKLTLDDCYYSTLIPAIEAVKHGTTTIIDHHASPFAVDGSLDRVADAVKQVGLRASLCYELSDRDGSEVAQAGIEESIRFVKLCKAKPDDHLRAMFGLHASFTLTDATLERAAAAGADLGVGFHIHVAEARTDQTVTKRRSGRSVVERLHDHGVLGEKTVAAHCVHVDDSEIDILKETGTAVVHNPQSNLNNAVGIADIVRMSDRGVLLGLGTDAMTTNMLEELRVALWSQHIGHRNPSIGFMETVSALVSGNPRIAGRHWDAGLGELKPGSAADIIIIDYFPPTPFDEKTLYGHLVFGLSQSIVDTTIVGGRILMKHKELLLDVDEEEAATKSRELAKELWKRF